MTQTTEDHNMGARVENARHREGFAIYPNPASGFVTIEYALEEKQVGVLNIYDLTGSILFSRLLNSNTSKMNVELEGCFRFVLNAIGDKRAEETVAAYFRS